MTHSRTVIITESSSDIGQRIAKGLDADGNNRILNGIEVALRVNGARTAH